MLTEDKGHRCKMGFFNMFRCKFKKQKHYVTTDLPIEPFIQSQKCRALSTVGEENVSSCTKKNKSSSSARKNKLFTNKKSQQSQDKRRARDSEKRLAKEIEIALVIKILEERGLC